MQSPRDRISEVNRDRLLYWYSFFMAFPAIVIFFNFSIYIFYFLYQSYREKFRFNLSLKPVEAKLALLFILGATISLFDIWSMKQGFLRIERGLLVLPNYIYWGVLIIFMRRHANNISIYIIRKALFWGLIISLTYFFIPFLYALRNLPILKGLQQNILSFLLLSFVPLALTYVRARYGVIIFWIVGLSFSVLAFLSGSRTGSVLVTLGFFIMAMYYSRFNLLLWLTGPLLIGTLVVFGVGFDNAIKKLNSRTYNLIYNNDKFLQTDFSYLTRVAILHKGLALYTNNPISGIGLNSFSATTAKIDYNFEGGELIAHNDKFFQTASAHNSYLSILVETGLLGFIPFIALLTIPLVKLYRNFIGKSRNAIGLAILVGYSSMLIHMYFISGILNVFAWFMIGLVCVYNSQVSNANKK